MSELFFPKGPGEHIWLFRLRSRCRRAAFGNHHSVIDNDFLCLVNGTAQDTGDEKRSQEGGGTHFEWRPQLSFVSVGMLD